MNAKEYERMRAVEDSNWWFAGKRRVVEALVRQALGGRRAGLVLDVGCGTGATLQMLARYGEPVGTDFAPLALAFSKQRGCERLCAGDAQRLAFRDGIFDVVVALDIIEHLDDPVQALREMRRVCAPDGLVIITVPAHPVLWSSHDVALAHRRRYTSRLLREQMATAGLSISRLSHAYAALFLPALAVRRLRRISARGRPPEADLGRVAGPINALLCAYMRLEAAALRGTSLPVGTSLVCVASRDS